jgi:hypothetical protein
LNLRPLPCQIQRAITALYSGRSRNVKDGRKAAAKNKRKGMDAPTVRHAPPAITSVPSTVGCCPYAAATAEPYRGRVQRPGRRAQGPRAGAGEPIGEDRVVGPVDLGSAPEVRADTLAVPSSPKAHSGREGKMHNQHVGLTGVLAEQRMTERQRQATYERLVRSARLPRRRRQQATRRWWQLVLRPMGA